MKEITLERLPATVEELAAMPQAALTVPEEVAALTVAALARFPENQEDAVRMLDFLRGPRPLNGTVSKRSVPGKRISDAVIFCRIFPRE